LPEIVCVDQLAVRINGNPVLEDITFQIRAGELAGIIGPNGAGKTTLLRVLLGLINPLSGTAALFGRPSDRLGHLREKIGYMPQSHYFDRRFPLSAVDVAMMGLLSTRTLWRPLNRRQRDAGRRALDAVGVLHLAERPFQELSGGEQQRVLLGRSLARDPALLILDEPGASLDISAQRLFLDLLRRLQQERGLTVLLVSHDLIASAAFADYLICINRTMHLHGSPHEVLHSPGLKEAFRCQFDLLHMAGTREAGE
jgi:zinc transport system ATP-binding protein